MEVDNQYEILGLSDKMSTIWSACNKYLLNLTQLYWEWNSWVWLEKSYSDRPITVKTVWDNKKNLNIDGY